MPLTGKGSKILSAMQSRYGAKKGESVFYASINSGKLRGAEGKASGGAVSLAYRIQREGRKRKYQDGGEVDESAYVLSPQAAAEAAAARTRQSVRPAEGRASGELTQFIEDTMIPKTPLDAGLMVAGGPFGRLAKVGALGLGAALQSSEAEAGPFGKLVQRASRVAAREPEKVEQAAIRINDQIFTGQNHLLAMEKAEKELGTDALQDWTMRGIHGEQHDGFVTSMGRFVSRAEAANIAKRDLGKRNFLRAEDLPDEGFADGGPVDRLPEHYAEIGAPRIEDRRYSDPTLRAMGLAALKNRASGKQARNRMASDMGSAEIVDMMVPRGYADGGVMDSPYSNVMPKSPAPHAGFIPGPTGGRTDAVPMKVQKGAYVIPSDLVSATGEGNSAAGAAKMSKMFSMKGAPYGAKAPKIKGRPLKTTKIIRQRFQDGGIMEDEAADILASDGEFIVPPSVVERIGGGSLDHGHDVLDSFVKQMRKQYIKKLSRLPPPKKG